MVFPNTLSPPSDGYQSNPIRPDEFRTISFRTDMERRELNYIEFRAQGFDGGDDSGEFVSLYTGMNQRPHIEIVGFENFTSTPVGGPGIFSGNLHRATPAQTTILEANKVYWLLWGVEQGSSDSFRLDSTRRPPDWHQYGEIHTENGATWEQDEQPFTIREFHFGLANADRRPWDHGWWFHAQNRIPFGISATIIPEPSTYAFAVGLLLIGFITFRRIRNCSD